jgi:hypothetical protein
MGTMYVHSITLALTVDYCCVTIGVVPYVDHGVVACASDPRLLGSPDRIVCGQPERFRPPPGNKTKTTGLCRDSICYYYRGPSAVEVLMPIWFLQWRLIHGCAV